MWSLVMAGLTGGLLVACANITGPAYQRPEVPDKATWLAADDAAASASEIAAAIDPNWWQGFGDTYLNELVERARVENVDLKILAARTEIAGAAIAQAGAGGLPVVNVGAGGNFQKSSGLPLSEQYSTATDVQWELDIWGKVKKGVEAQQAAYQASQADWQAGYLTLVSDVARTYFQIRQFDEQVDRLVQALAINQRILDIHEGLLQESLIPETQVLQQRAEVNRLERDLLERRRFRTLSENALATLLGIPAGELKVPVAALQTHVQAIEVPAGLPADLLKRRPDIIAAELRVLEAHNLTGQARLAQLPSISLTGRAGSASFALTDLLRSWTLGLLPTLNFPLFDPTVRARLKLSEAQAKVAAEQYRRTVMQAFEEVENALTNLANRKQQRMALMRQLTDLRIVADQIRAQLDEGVISQLEVFESERGLLAAELALLDNHQQILSDTIALYKAMGGGWPVMDVARPVASSR